MSKLGCALLLMLGLFSLVSPHVGASGAKTIAVVELSNNLHGFGHSVSGLERLAEEKLVTLFANMDGFRVAEKQRLISIIDEQKFSISGLVDDGETAVELGRIAGAEHIVTGTLNSLTLEEESFSGYGLVLRQVNAEFEASLRMINVTTGIVEIADTYWARETIQGQRRNSVDVRAVGHRLLDDIVNQFATAIDKFGFAHAKQQPIVIAEFSSHPHGASVQIDGLFVGNTPLTIPIQPGVHAIRISLGGYEPWEMKARISEDFYKINVDLGLPIQRSDP